MRESSHAYFLHWIDNDTQRKMLPALGWIWLIGLIEANEITDFRIPGAEPVLVSKYFAVMRILFVKY